MPALGTCCLYLSQNAAAGALIPLTTFQPSPDLNRRSLVNKPLRWSLETLGTCHRLTCIRWSSERLSPLRVKDKSWQRISLLEALREGDDQPKQPALAREGLYCPARHSGQAAPTWGKSGPDILQVAKPLILHISQLRGGGGYFTHHTRPFVFILSLSFTHTHTHSLTHSRTHAHTGLQLDSISVDVAF